MDAYLTYGYTLVFRARQFCVYSKNTSGIKCTNLLFDPKDPN